MIKVRTTSVDDTRDLAAAVSELFRPGDVVLLSGDLGAGKTVFAQGVGRGLGVDDVVTSPTFTLVRDYEGRIRLHHLDVYRLDQLHEVIDLGIGELLDEGIVVIEWGDAVAAALPKDYLEIAMRFGTTPDERIVTVRPLGPRWAARAGALAAAVEPWTKDGPNGDLDDPGLGPGAEL